MTEIPRILGGRYELGDLIGRGGMAQVHKGYDTRLSRTVAIKVLRADLAADPTFLARFRREARSAAALNHPAIVAVYDTSEEQIKTSSGKIISLPYIVMELVRGKTVSKLLENGKAVPISEAVQITIGVLSALEYSHREGIIHRDIKPGNIMLTTDGKVKVTDFGIARAIADSAATMTSTNSVVGTAQYLSPEQARGEVVDARSDLYSTGCLLYELLTGKPPFQGDSAVAVAYQHVSQTPRPASEIAPDIPEALDRVVMKALAKRREDRYQTAAEMHRELSAAMHGEAVAAPQVDTWKTRVVPIPPRPVEATQIAAGPLPGAAAGQTDTDIEIPSTPQKSHNIWKWVAGILILLVLTGVGIAAWNDALPWQDKGTEVTRVSVPDMSNMTQADARRALEEVGLVFALGDPVEDEKVPVGRFVSSNPAIRTMVDKGSTVTVHFSSGVGEATVPDLSNGSYTEESARAELKSLGLIVGAVEKVDEPGIAAGKVFDTDPSAGTPVDKGTRITLYVSTGKVTLPTLIGKSLEAAQNELNARKLNYDTVYESNDSPQGTVIKQEPLAGKVDSNTRVKLTISNGPKNKDNTQPPHDNSQPATPPRNQ